MESSAARSEGSVGGFGAEGGEKARTWAEAASLALSIVSRLLYTGRTGPDKSRWKDDGVLGLTAGGAL